MHFTFECRQGYVIRMHPLERLLAAREAYRARLDREIDALRISLELLADSEAATPPAAMLANAGRGAAPAGARLTAASVAQARAASSLPALPTESMRPAAAVAVAFPPARDGAITCDACGHRNPTYVTDCEECDIPIRPRE